MKKFILFVILLFAFCNSSLFAEIIWSDYVQAPNCNMTRCTTSVVFEAPKDLKICVSDYPSDFPECSTEASNCCYTIVYYDGDLMGFPGSSGSYYLYIAGIFWEGTDCDECSKEKILEIFYREHFQSMLNEGWWKDPIEQSWTTGGCTFLVTPGKCKSNMDEFCYDICCKSIVQFNVDRYTGIITSMSIYPPEPWCIDCPPFNNPDCQPYCYDFPFQDMTEILCDIPCNYGAWHNGVLDDIELPFCLGCTLKIHYKWRETIDCEPNNYFDMKIEAPNPNDPTQHAIEFSGSGCDNCNQNDPAFNYKVYNFACNYVLKNGEIPKPDYQQSSVYYRVLNYHCWGIWFLEPPFGDGWIFEKCDLTKCCWAQFRITNSGNPDIGDVINVELIYGTTNEEGCHVYPHPCSTYCVEALTTIWGSNLSAVGSNTVNYINNNFKININPNPSTYDRILRIESDYLGEISFEVFNNLGELVSSEKLNKSSKIFERILKIDNLANGFYKACVIIKGKQIYCCKFIVIK